MQIQGGNKLLEMLVFKTPASKTWNMIFVYNSNIKSKSVFIFIFII